MSISAGIIVLVIVFAVGALLSARAGIRSIQAARSVVFYRTRRARMVAGQQWLVVAFVLLALAIASAAFGQPIANQVLPPTLTPIPSATWTPEPTRTPLPPSTNTQTPVPTQLASETLTSAPTSSATSAPAPSSNSAASCYRCHNINVTASSHTDSASNRDCSILNGDDRRTRQSHICRTDCTNECIS